MNGIFVTGTDTEVGKTWISCALIRMLRQRVSRVGAYKPVASGLNNEADSDAYQLWEATGRLESLQMVCPQSFIAPLAPPVAASLEGREVDQALLEQGAHAWNERCDFLVVEGAGGLLSPLTFESTNSDLASKLGFPIVIVVADRLGAVNQSLMAIEVAASRQLEIAAIVLNETSLPSGAHRPNPHASMIERQLQSKNLPVPIIIELIYGQSELDESQQKALNRFAPPSGDGGYDAGP